MSLHTIRLVVEGEAPDDIRAFDGRVFEVEAEGRPDVFTVEVAGAEVLFIRSSVVYLWTPEADATFL